MNQQILRAAVLAAILASPGTGNSQPSDVGPGPVAPALDATLVPRPGMMIGRVMTRDGRPVPRFTIEYAAYEAGKDGVRMSSKGEPNAVAQVEGRDGYYEIRLPEGSFGLVSGVTLPLLEGKQTFRFWAETPGLTRLDFLEIERGNPGVIKNFVWNVRLGGAAAFVASPHYGASLTVVDMPELVRNIPTRSLASAHPPRSRVLMTFTPRGRLIDATEGRVLNKWLALPDLGGRGATLRDIPFAIYEISARLVGADGSESPLRIATGPMESSADGMNRTFRWQASVVVDFVPLASDESMGGRSSLGVVLSETP